MADKTWEDVALDLGDKLRYGKTAAEKYAELVNSPEYIKAKTEADRNEALRAQSARMAAEHLPGLGAVASPLLTGLREGVQGLGSVLKGGEFFTPEGAVEPEEDMSWTSGFNRRSMESAIRGAVEGTGNILKRFKARNYVRGQ